MTMPSRLIPLRYALKRILAPENRLWYRRSQPNPPESILERSRKRYHHQRGLFYQGERPMRAVMTRNGGCRRTKSVLSSSLDAQETQRPPADRDSSLFYWRQMNESTRSLADTLRAPILEVVSPVSQKQHRRALARAVTLTESTNLQHQRQASMLLSYLQSCSLLSINNSYPRSGRIAAHSEQDPSRRFFRLG
jgi:hypothetical protein